MRPLLVGEVNPYGSDPGMALYPLPEGASGDRLRRILGMTRAEYLRTFDRVNLCEGTWSTAAARRRAKELICGGRPGYVLLGRRVAEAFGWRRWPAFSSNFHFVFLPHPSGRCREWDRLGSEERARQLVASLLALIAKHAHGEGKEAAG